MAVEVEIILKSAEKLLESKLEGKELLGDIRYQILSMKNLLGISMSMFLRLPVA